MDISWSVHHNPYIRNPATPAIIIISMGCSRLFFCFIFIGKYTRMKAATQMAMFVHSCQFIPLGLKLAAFISIIAAEAISPTTTGRNPENMAFIAPLSLWRLYEMGAVEHK